MKRTMVRIISGLVLIYLSGMSANADEGLGKLYTAKSTIRVKLPHAEALKETKALLPKTLDVKLILPELVSTSYVEISVEAPTAEFAANFVNKNTFLVVRALKASNRAVDIFELADPASEASMKELGAWVKEHGFIKPE